MKSYGYLFEVYDKLMYDVDYCSWAAYISGFLRKRGVNSIFEAACGTGKMTFELYRLGFNIAASDISPEMLETASGNSRKQGYGIRFILQDMRNIEVGNKVDAVISACDGPNYIDIDGFHEFALSAYEALNDKGALLFDISSAAKLKSMDGQVYFDDTEDASYIWQNTYDKNRNILLMDITLFVRRGRLFERFTERHTQFAHDAGVLRRDLLSIGYKEVDVYECFTEKKPDGCSQRVQFVCSK
jgi:SAM-dependent methyltransferase